MSPVLSFLLSLSSNLFSTSTRRVQLVSGFKPSNSVPSFILLDVLPHSRVALFYSSWLTACILRSADAVAVPDVAVNVPILKAFGLR